MTIQQATANDMPEIMALVSSVFSGEQAIPPELIPIPAEKSPRWWCIRQEGRIAATVALYRDGEEWHMGRLAVAPGLRGGHIATRLLDTAIPAVFAMGIDTIHTECRDATVHILKRFGGEITGQPQTFFNGSITPVTLRRENLPREFLPLGKTEDPAGK